MRIANPIYDVVFKYLLQNNEIAILILSTILEEDIVSLDFLPQETSIALESQSFTVYHLDFSARIRTPDGTLRQVVIEIPKAKFTADIMRFRRYLGEQYKEGFRFAGANAVEKAKDKEAEAPQPIPIISIYFLGYRLEQVRVPVIKVLRTYYDAATGQAIPAREDFIENLTHDSFVIQIPCLGPERRTAAEQLLAVFDQHLKVADDGHLLDIDETAYPGEYRQVIRRLSQAIEEPEISRIMRAEDEILAGLAAKERQIEKQGEALAEKDKALKEKDKVLEEKDQALEEKDRLIAELRKSR